jgi:hypothetical protein
MFLLFDRPEIDHKAVPGCFGNALQGTKPRLRPTFPTGQYCQGRF